MKTSLRITAILLGLLGLERIVYAEIILLVPGMSEPTPVVSAAIGLAIVVAAMGVFLGFGWSRRPSVIGATFVLLQGFAYIAWNLGRGLGPIAVIIGLLEPLLALLIVDRLVRHWPADVAWNERLR
jgi:hypothetical protein